MSNNRALFGKSWPAGYKAMLAFNQTVADSGLDKTIGELIKIRASQLNGCAFCLDMHVRDAVAMGETQQRLGLVAAWREAAGVFTEAERAALALTEAVTGINNHAGVPQEVYAEALRVFGEETLAKVVYAIVVINAWNMLNVTQELPFKVEHPHA
ncbi:carboxymuconolactone decarboxylase family protein [Crossiella sp. CA-258035]|uniref:carboxymuconolactone decarboxylase family protein n=1 Tax=Crossiella sp. CA-258035 TaxID=2981138 RepID=UPI0024BCDD63|nr:carboxymuconolactone decarboxylase family protein [Crossiella sp. CA-258035]WHT20481.1 carboxymuconolactone decarboxylase family protein [Crossiella sp. CA-258035]